jgi:predicted metal-dependent hydrolase
MLNSPKKSTATAKFRWSCERKLRYNSRAHSKTTLLKSAPYQLNLGIASVAVAFVRNPKARRYILRFSDGVARVTIPRGGSMEYAREFARKNQAWIEKQWRRAPADWADGTEVLFRGECLRLSITPVDSGVVVRFADQHLDLDPADDLRIAVESRMRTLATKELPTRTLELAREQGMEVQSVSVRNQRSRWGSCSARKRISLNWRLIQTPPFVTDYIIVHELMHLKEMNHSARFWEHVERAFPAYREAEKWLRRNSGLLR